MGLFLKQWFGLGLSPDKPVHPTLQHHIQAVAGGYVVTFSDSIPDYDDKFQLLPGIVAEVFIYDGEVWFLRVSHDGELVFAHCCYEDEEDFEPVGSVDTLVELFPKSQKNRLANLLEYWDDDTLDRLANPEDEVPAGDPWQAADVIAALGFEYVDS